MKLEGKTIGFIMTGSFCNFRNVIDEIEKIIKLGATVIPIMSENAYTLNTKYGDIEKFKQEIEEITQAKILHTIQETEQIGPMDMLDIAIVTPATSNTIAKLANDIIDEPSVMAVKSHLRRERPIVIGIATDDGLAGGAQNIGKLLNMKHYYFIPFRQDNPITKPRSLAFDSSYLITTLEYALDNEQIQPILL